MSTTPETITLESPKQRRKRKLLEYNRRWRAKHLPPPAFTKMRQAGQPITREMILSNVAIAQSSGCWEWMRSKKPAGYGTIWDNRKLTTVHRVAYRLWVGPIPDGLCVLHRCENPCWCNPYHLFLGTYKDNRIDCVSKGRHGGITHPEAFLRGTQNPRSKLDDHKVLEIKRLLTDPEFTQRGVAKIFSVSNQTICDIANGKHWRHISL